MQPRQLSKWLTQFEVISVAPSPASFIHQIDAAAR